MTLTYATLTLDLPLIETKKGRRAVTNSIKERLKNMNCSVLDLSLEYPKEAAIAIAFLSENESSAHKKIEKIEQLIQNRWPHIEASLDYETM
ncbi:MAG: DUF503 family protein [Hydrogenimonas sp.]|nr:DUF503 family protein [Hydrogenimonas sp.]